MMERFQPEGRYEPISENADIYRDQMRIIKVLECQITGYEGKWKLGQNRSEEQRRSFIDRFRERNQGNDRRCADEIEKWLDTNPGR